MAEFPSRIPPHNLDAERAVLGAVLLEGREALPRVIEVLRPSDFYTEAHRTIYDTMLRLFDRGEPVDLITLSEELRRTDQLEFVGGPSALALLVEQASIAAHLMSYAVITRDMAVLRELIQTSTQIITQAFDAKEEVQSVVDDAERRALFVPPRASIGFALDVHEEPGKGGEARSPRGRGRIVREPRKGIKRRLAALRFDPSLRPLRLTPWDPGDTVNAPLSGSIR